MKLVIAVATLLFCSTVFAFPRTSGYHVPTYKSAYSTPVQVSGHVTKAGTYVAPSYRTAPNKTKTDNWSSKPNVNPYSGKAGTKNPYAAPNYGH